MKTLTLKARADKDGILRLEIPNYQANQEFEIVLVMQSISKKPVDSMGYPVGYFDETYGIMAHEPLERDQPLDLDLRDDIE